MPNKPTIAHQQRITQELKDAGVTGYGMMKFVSRYLANVIHDSEHIKGVVYGRYRAGFSLLKLNEGMLVATNRRILFLDHKPGYTSLDELTYEVVSGVVLTKAGFTGLTLHTRLGDYSLRFVNPNAAKIFISYIEAKRIENSDKAKAETLLESVEPYNEAMTIKIDPKAIKFLKSQELGVLSTIDHDGNVHGAAIYYLINDDASIHFMTKSETQKIHSTLANQKVALTVFSHEKMQTVQLQGNCRIETDQSTKNYVFSRLSKSRQYGKSQHLPPVTQLKKGAFIVMKITPTTAKYSDYK